MSLRRGNERYGNLDYNQRRIIDISEKLKPVLSRKVYELPEWHQNLLEFNISPLVKNQWKRNCFTCGRRERKDSARYFCLFNSIIKFYLVSPKTLISHCKSHISNWTKFSIHDITRDIWNRFWPK